MFPKVIEVGGFFLPSYGVLISTAFLVGLWVATRLGRLAGLHPDKVMSLGVYTALAALAGAKLFLIVEDFEYYRENPGELLSLSTLQAGGVFYGGLIAALAVAFFYMRRQKMPALVTMDAFAPGISLGHAIGRVGCFAAGCCWGTQCDRPWAVTFTNADANRMFGVPLHVPLHPTQLYEALAEAAIFVLLWRMFHRPHHRGQVIGAYLLLYSAARFVIEFFRDHPGGNPLGSWLSTAQAIALGLAALGAWLLMRKSARFTPTALAKA